MKNVKLGFGAFAIVFAFVIIFVLSLVFITCKKDEKNNEKWIVGTWILE